MGGGFGNLAFYIALVFNTLRILPDNHPYVQSYNRNNFSVLQAIGAAADHLTFDKKNIDKVVIFFVTLAGLVMLLMQLVLCVVALFSSRALAYDGPEATHNSVADFLSNPNDPTKDLAFRIMDMIFGIPDIFNTADNVTVEPFHKALHALFAFYSYGIMLVGVIVITYLVIAIVLETAQKGTPFGERFKGWAPVRLILFFGLLLPTASGINMAQYLVLEAARLGSNLATNAWITFDEGVKGTPYLGKPEELIAKPIPPDLGSLVSFMQLSQVCSWAEGRVNGRDIRPYTVFSNEGSTTTGNVEPAVELSASGGISYTEASEKSDGGTIFIRFGEKDEKRYAKEPGGVFPYCGELMLTIIDSSQPGATLMQQAYLELVTCIWHGQNYQGSEESVLGESPLCKNTLSNMRGRNYTDRYTVRSLNPQPDMSYTEWGNAKIAETVMMKIGIDKATDKARKKQVDDGDWLNASTMELGWAGAGMWFNKIAEQNGAFTSSIFAKPEIRKLPYVMEYVRQKKTEINPNTPVESLYLPTLSTGGMIDFEEPQQREVLLILNQLFLYWGSDNTTFFVKSIPETHTSGLTGNVIIDVMNTFLGTRGLFDMCKNTDVHPLAQLTSLGRGMVDHAIRGFAMAAGTGIAGGLLQILGQGEFAGVLSSATSFFLGFASLGLMAGFILFYLVPFLPFIYFFFAVMTWAKGIFEAMVGVPLWALAHLRIDGEGMPGPKASQGYYHILEIFLRPTGIMIGFIGSIVIFAAMVKVLNQIFYLAVSNVTGHYVGEATGCFAPPPGADGTIDGEYPTEDLFLGGVIDEFFYTVMYAIIVYLCAVPCFKLVDLIPDYAMRWFANIQPFGAQDGDSVEGITTYLTTGAAAVGGKLQGGMASAFSMFGLKG